MAAAELQASAGLGKQEFNQWFQKLGSGRECIAALERSALTREGYYCES